MYIHERENWTNFRWDNDEISVLLDTVCREQGRLFGRLECVGFESQLRAVAENLTRDVVFSSEIEGIELNVDAVRSSIARRLGIENVKFAAASHYVDAVVAVMLDAMENYDMVLTREKLCAWQSAFFPTGFSEGSAIEVGRYRTHEEHIISGAFGREKIHYIAPAPERVEAEMARFIDWFNSPAPQSPVIRSAIAHLWFVAIHPFEDGNGRLARILADMFLARGDRSKLRFYNIASAINRDKKHYYRVLEQTTCGNGDLTAWIVWYLKTLLSAIQESDAMLSSILNKSVFWMRAASIPLTERQTQVLNVFLDGYEAKITSKAWSDLAKCSKDTAIRDIQDLLQKGLLREDSPGAKRPSYSICYTDSDVVSSRCKDVEVRESGGQHFLVGECCGHQLRERILPLDAERFAKGEITLENLVGKYCSYLALAASYPAKAEIPDRRKS